MNSLDQNFEDLALTLNAIIETAIDGIITIDERGKIESINRAAVSLFQYSKEEVVGKNVSILMPNPHQTNHDSYIKKYQNTGVAHIIGIGREVEGLKKDGTLFPFNLAISEVKLKDRTIYTGIIHDLTAIKNAQIKILDLNNKLEEKVVRRTNELEEVVNKLLATNIKLHDREAELKIALEKEKELNILKSRFVSMASHEFRTPLSTINSSASLISKYPEGDQNQQRLKHINRIKSAVENLTLILNDFLSLSKLEEGKTITHYSDVKLQNLAEEVFDSIQSIKKEGQKINVYLDNEELIIYSDKNIVKNIMFNLLSNAIKYSDEHTNIKCSIETESNYTIFTVQDQGMGIPDSEKKFMFERFFRASNAENIQGTGLGLNIVKSYLELLHGDITYESEIGVGTTFIVRIPN